MQAASAFASQPPFQFLLYFVALAVMLVLNLSGLIGKTINAAAWAMAWEEESRGESEISNDLIASARRPPSGKTIGIVESSIYLYAMFSQQFEFITAVLMFKAFSGWLATSAATKDGDVRSPKTLSSFYHYAIGNVASLASCIVVFEGIRLLLHFQWPPFLQSLVLQ